jgi:hypothetical protein
MQRSPVKHVIARMNLQSAVADSTDRRNTLRKTFGRSLVLQVLSGAFVELSLHRAALYLSVQLPRISFRDHRGYSVKPEGPEPGDAHIGRQPMVPDFYKVPQTIRRNQSVTLRVGSHPGAPPCTQGARSIDRNGSRTATSPRQPAARELLGDYSAAIGADTCSSINSRIVRPMARPRSGGTALPTCTYWSVFDPWNSNQSGKACSRAASLTDTARS